jgi:tRNA(Ile)-lysidine synthase
MVLLRVLHELAPRHGWRLTVAHLNHALRGRSSDADEHLVRRTAEGLNLPVRVERAEVRSLARAQGLSLEMAARKVRHEFLARTAAQLASPSVAVAHQADDQVELFFLRLFRGSSGEGLAGMKWRNPSPGNAEVELVRPLLDQPRSALLNYAAERGIRFREDASNASLDFPRNRIRQELLPLLRARYQPALARIILRTADILGGEAQLATQAAAAWLGAQRRKTQASQRPETYWPPFSCISVPFDKLPVAVQRRILQLQLLSQGIVADYFLIEELRSAADKPVTVGPLHQAVEDHSAFGLSEAHPADPCEDDELGDHSGADAIAGTLAAIRDRSGLVHLQTTKAEAFNADALPLALRGPAGEARFAGVLIRWRISRRRGAGRAPAAPGQECFDADKVGPAILLRHWQPGDRFQPIGMAQSLKLQDFFTNQKVSLVRRRRLIVAVTAKGEVFWVEGMRIAEWFKLSKGTIRRLQWRWERL